MSRTINFTFSFTLPDLRDDINEDNSELEKDCVTQLAHVLTYTVNAKLRELADDFDDNEWEFPDNFNKALHIAGAALVADAIIQTADDLKAENWMTSQVSVYRDMGAMQ